jgi:signal transduction histidine kinase
VRRVLVVTAAQAVGITSVLVGGVVAGLLLWPGDPLATLAGDATSLDGTPATPLVMTALVGAVIAASVVALGVAKVVADKRADRVAGLLATLGERAERGSADPKPVPLKSGIVEVDRLDSALARGSQQSAKRLASERDFAADASHQLRTPLTALLMRLEEIAATDDPEVVAEEATIAIGQVERLSKVVDDLMSRTRSGVDTNPAVSLDSVLASLQREWQPAFAGARRSVKISGERGVQVRATPVALGQILTTLLENSLAYGRGTVEIAARRAGPSVVIEVTDEGDGVAPALAPHIFERSVSSTGSGLGLSLARDLAEAAGGRLELVRAKPPLFALFLSTSS